MHTAHTSRARPQNLVEIFRIVGLKFGDYCRICSEIAVSIILTRLHRILPKLHFATAEKNLHEYKFTQRSEKVLLK